MKEIQQVRGVALQVMRTWDAVEGWLTTPNRAFGGQSPLEVVECGEAARVLRAIHEMASGQPG